MRISYAPSEATPGNEAIYSRIAERRKPRPLIPLDLALLQNPAIADGWNTLLGAIRTKSSLSQATMEMAISYIAVMTQAYPEWTSHSALALKAGVSREKLGALLRSDVKNKEIFSEEEMDVLAFTEQSTKNVKIDDEVFERVKSRFTEQQVMELTVTVSGYNMVARFLVGLDVAEGNGKKLEVP